VREAAATAVGLRVIDWDDLKRNRALPRFDYPEFFRDYADYIKDPAVIELFQRFIDLVDACANRLKLGLQDSVIYGDVAKLAMELRLASDGEAAKVAGSLTEEDQTSITKDIVPVREQYKNSILEGIKNLGHDPLNFPITPKGKTGGAKRAVKDHMGKIKPTLVINCSKKSKKCKFDNLWQELRDEKRIKDAVDHS
jgi:hypothetical protein